ncbi:MAG: beta-N-acetylhexosaminidase [Chitinophagaceae bacterium]|nr:beta-N-acetylhexosaminidase [Chitinophagaceae bacterium]
MTLRFFIYRPFSVLIIFLLGIYNAFAQQTDLAKAGLDVIPYPKEVKITAPDFKLAEEVVIAIDKNASESDRFAAEQLSERLLHDFKIKSSIQQAPSSAGSIVLTRKVQGKKLHEQGYSLTVNADRVIVSATGEAGLFYGVQTLIQLIQNKNAQTFIKGVEISDWPDTKIRAAHYDTKHHQDKREYVEKFIRDLAAYKINMIVWEWEDKLLYPSHPEIGAPGAFTMQDMQEITRYAKKFHIQLTPLVQGLGHSSYILKWPQFARLREIPASNFEFCPLKDSSYKLLFDLWEDAINATPGSQYIHIGSDETYELGECAACKKKAEEIGKNGLYHLFTTRAAKHLQSKGRKVMIWERPMGWKMGENATHKNISPQKGIVLTESYGYETPDLKYAKEAKALGFPVFAYDPNPGVEPLFLPYFFRKPREFATEKITGSLENSYNFLSSQLGQGVFDGVICTSWDDSGLHNQVWMMRFAAAAAFSWNASKPSLPEFTSSFFKNYYGSEAKDVEKLFYLLNEGGIYFMETFERSLWHDKRIGKTRIPDLPRGDVLEYNPFWNEEYKGQVKTAGEMLVKMDEALAICKANSETSIKNEYDFEIFETIAQLVKHTALTYLDLSALETAVAEAHRQHHLDHEECYRNLEKAEDIIQKHLERREKTLNHLITVWDKTRLPKGMSTSDKKFFFEQDRTIHFANRAPDMSFLVLDEQKLGLEDYLAKLRELKESYRDKFIGEIIRTQEKQK